MKVDMSPEAVTNRLKTMEQLWELSVNLMQAREISETNSSDEKARNDWNDSRENESRKYLDEFPPS